MSSFSYHRLGLAKKKELSPLTSNDIVISLLTFLNLFVCLCVCMFVCLFDRDVQKVRMLINTSQVQQCVKKKKSFVQSARVNTSSEINKPSRVTILCVLLLLMSFVFIITLFNIICAQFVLLIYMYIQEEQLLQTGHVRCM